MRARSHQADEASAVCACSATSEETQDGDGTADENEDGRQLFEERQ